MSKVIACIDGSNVTPAVCDYAAWASLKMDAPLLILHVLDKSEFPTETNLSGNIGLGSRESLLEELSELDEKRAKLALEQGRLMLEAARDRAIADGIDNPATMQRHGDLVGTLLDMEADTRLWVLGKHDENLAEHLGSRLESAVRALHRPILVTSVVFKQPERIMIAFDGSTTTKKGIDMIAASPLFTGVACHIVMAGKNTASLDWAREKLEGAGFDVTTAMKSGDIEKVLCDYRRDHDIDMIVMGAYGHSVIRRFLVGSTTTNMIRNARVPVLLLR
jgi:nucleotide-binding universal stress UspA family protein